MVPDKGTVLPSYLTKLTAYGNLQPKELLEELWLRERLAKMLVA